MRSERGGADPAAGDGGGAHAPRRIPAWAAWLVLAAAVGAAVALALGTPAGVHPDEIDHFEAVRYFQRHAWPPPPGSDAVWYSAYGWSRVYSGEWIYWAIGRLSAAAAGVDPAAASLRAARLLNALSLVALLAPLLFGRSRFFRLDLCGVFLASIPQVVYVASYLDDDAWTMATAAALLRVALGVYERDGRGGWAPFGLLLGLALGAKRNAWVIVPFALALAMAGWRRSPARRWRGPLGALLLALALVAPLRLVYPLSQPGDFGAALAAMRSERARPDLDPSAPSAPGFRLRARGAGIDEVLLAADWWKRSAGSAYGLFGAMTLVAPRPLYLAAAALGLLLAGLQLEAWWRRARGDPEPRGRILAGAAAAVVAMVAAAVFHSWSFDYQPQGRYLFPALAPLALLVTGLDSPRPRLRAGVLAALALTAAATLAWAWTALVAAG